MKFDTKLVKILIFERSKVGHKRIKSSWCKSREENWSKVHKAFLKGWWSKCFQFVMGIDLRSQTSSMAFGIIIWPWWPKIGAHWSKNDQKDTFKDRIGLYFRLPLLADQKSKHNFSLSNYVRKGQCFMGSQGNSTWWTINDQKDTTSFIHIGKNRKKHFFIYLHQPRCLDDQNCIQIKVIIWVKSPVR